MYCYSIDGEQYFGAFKSVEEAVDEAVNHSEPEHFYIGKQVPPSQPEEWWEAFDWLEHVSCQDEYSGDWADSWTIRQRNSERN